jgi:hypothetical protein
MIIFMNNNQIFDTMANSDYYIVINFNAIK